MIDPPAPVAALDWNVWRVCTGIRTTDFGTPLTAATTDSSASAPGSIDTPTQEPFDTAV